MNLRNGNGKTNLIQMCKEKNWNEIKLSWPSFHIIDKILICAVFETYHTDPIERKKYGFSYLDKIIRQSVNQRKHSNLSSDDDQRFIFQPNFIDFHCAYVKALYFKIDDEIQLGDLLVADKIINYVRTHRVILSNILDINDHRLIKVKGLICEDFGDLFATPQEKNEIEKIEALHEAWKIRKKEKESEMRNKIENMLDVLFNLEMGSCKLERHNKAYYSISFSSITPKPTFYSPFLYSPLAKHIYTEEEINEYTDTLNDTGLTAKIVPFDSPFYEYCEIPTIRISNSIYEIIDMLTSYQQIPFCAII